MTCKIKGDAKMVKRIAVFFPDIYLHRSHNEYTNNIYKALQEKYDVKPFEWFIKHPFNKNIEILYLNWYENTSSSHGKWMMRIEYQIKRIILKFAKMRRVRIVYVIHNKTPHNMDKNSLSYKKIVYPFLRFCLEVADRIVVLCNGTTTYLQEEFSDVNIVQKTHKVPLGKYTKYNEDTLSIREKYNIDPNEMVYCFLGSINPYKNVDLIMEAFSKASVKAKLLIKGKCEGEYRKKLEQIAATNSDIIFDPTYIEDDKAFSQLMQASDIVVLPYEYTSLNSSMLINAFSNGITAISSNIAMMSDFDKQLVYGYDFSNRESHLIALKEEIKEAYVSFVDCSLKEKGCVLQKLMEEEYSWDSVKKKLYEAVC